MSKKLNHPILHIPTRDEVASLKIGDYSLDCFGQMAEVVRVSFRGQDMLGRAYVGYYTRSRSGNGSTSMSIKQGCITRTAALSCKYTSDEIDREFVRCYFGDGSEAEVERHVLRHRAYKITSLIRVIYLLLILDASCGVSAEELKASMGKNFENVGGDYLEFARTHYEFFRKEWARYGDTF